MAVVGTIIQVMAPGPGIERADPGVIQSALTEENTPVLRFDDTNVETYDLLCALEGYGGTGLVLSMCWCSFATPTGTSDWEVGIRRLATGEDLDLAGDYVPVGQTLPQAGGRRQVTYTDWNLSNAQIDGLQDEERFIIRLNRNPPDNQSNDIEIFWPAIVIRET